MAIYKALKSFSGKISMIENEIKEISDKELIKDLTKAGYIVEEKDSASVEVKKTRKKRDE